MPAAFISSGSLDHKNTKRGVGIKVILIVAGLFIALGVTSLLQTLWSDGPMSKIIEADRFDGIEFPWNHGWSLAVSVVPGLPIHFTDERPAHTLTVTFSAGRLIKIGKAQEVVLDQPVQMETGDTVYWLIVDQKSLEQKDDMHFVDVVIREQNHIVGYAVIKIAARIGKMGGKVYDASIVKNAEFPKVDGEYQAVSEEYVNKRISEAKR